MKIGERGTPGVKGGIGMILQGEGACFRGGEGTGELEQKALNRGKIG